MEAQNILPLKTKIAAWCMIIIAVIFILFGIKDIIVGSPFTFAARFLLIALVMLLPFLFSLYGGIFLLKKKKWAYFVSVITTAIIIIFSYPNLEEHYIWKLSFFFGILIFILLLLDRKNFFKITS